MVDILVDKFNKIKIYKFIHIFILNFEYFKFYIFGLYSYIY